MESHLMVNAKETQVEACEVEEADGCCGCHLAGTNLAICITNVRGFRHAPNVHTMRGSTGAQTRSASCRDGRRGIGGYTSESYTTLYKRTRVSRIRTFWHFLTPTGSTSPAGTPRSDERLIGSSAPSR